jgi:WD40 repeat protein
MVITFLDNGRLIADSHANVWEVASGEKMMSTTTALRGGNWLALAPDSSRAATLDGDGNLKTFDLLDDKPAASQIAHHDHGRAIDYSPDGKLIASGAERVLLWDATTMNRIAPLEYDSAVWCVVFSPDGRWLVSTHGDGAILIWDVVNRELEANLKQHSGAVRSVAISPDGKRLMSGGDDQSVILWNAESGQKESVRTAHETRVGAVAFSPDGSWFVSSDQSGDVIRWDIGRDTPRWVANARKNWASYFLAISPDGRFVATTFATYGAETGEALALYDSARGAIYSGAFTNDSSKLVGATDRGNVIVFDTQTWQVVENQQWTTSPLVSMSLSPDGTQIVTGEDAKIIRLGTVNPLQQTAVVGQHTARVKAVAFSPDGKQVASAGDDNMVALWDVNRRKLLTTIGTHTSPIYALAFSPDGRRLITGEHDRSVRQYTRRRSLWGFSFD